MQYFVEGLVRIFIEEPRKIKKVKMNKVCKECNIDKNLSEFRKGRNQCKKCTSDKYKDYHKKYYIENKNHLLLKMQKNYKENIEDRKLKNKKYREENIEYMKEYMINYRLENSEKIKEYKDKNKEYLKEYNKEYWNKRLKEDDLFRLKSILRKRIGCLLKNKSKSTEEIIGCSFEEFKNYLESKFEDWMNWENYGLYSGEYKFGWDIDHIKPLSSAKNEEEIYELFFFKNLQPLCSRENRYDKRDKY
jgi:hypothetical protein